MKRVRILAQFFLLVLGLLLSLAQAETYHVSEVSQLEVNSAITPATLDYLQYNLARTPQNSLILIKLNTPGGLISTTKDIITLLSSQKKPIVLWITPEGASAASAGAIIAAAAHFILMSPGTNMGAATPVGLGGDIQDKDGRAKMLNDLKATVRSLNQARKRNSLPFEEMIEQAKSMTDKEGLDAGIVAGNLMNTRDLPGLLDQKTFVMQSESFILSIDKNVPLTHYEATIGQEMLNVLANPSTAYFLFLLGIALLYFEFQAPGGYIAGALGTCLLILAAISFQVLPLDWGALALILTGIVLLIAEVYVTSYGLLGIAGVAAFIAGSLFLFHGEGGFISVDYPVLISTLLGIGCAIAIIVWYLLKESAHQRKSNDFFLPVGSRGIILATSLGQRYQIKVKGEIWNGISDQELSVGDSVEVISAKPEQLLIQVKKVSKE